LGGDVEQCDGVLVVCEDVVDHRVVGATGQFELLLKGSEGGVSRKLDQNNVLVFHIREGRITEAWEAWTDEAAWDEFWL
jgi:ketosteroid isomerase-like protein